ncbi:thioredoxin family protein [Paenibacillaceae sp. P-4]|uniref:Thioredoxin family protein n=1 Tax=Paenibacillus suaedae TaxID=3077233 RepID=A0AAJ2N443_9BACL|nr:thioredoxin family protein [Paenibacillus sp. chi10]MDT8976396.1 thioredoxin family protein [Paenibacillus sp. chi10]
MSMYEVNEQSFQGFIRVQGVTLVEFGASWCPPCKALLPILDELDHQYGEQVTVLQVDCDDSPAIASEYRVMSMPTVMMFHNGEPVEKLIGLRLLHFFW